FKKTSHMAMESKKAYGFLFQISTKTNKKELAIKPLLFVYSLSHYQIFGSGFFGSVRVVQNINSRWVRTYVIASLEKVVLVLFELLVRCDNKVSIQ
ncbi:hypothetical protein Q3F77_11405, partial [Enterococcus faecium]|nr:hypothetical protein [Enterococcus faecium]